MAMELAAALARPAQTGSRSATEAAAAVAMELAAALARPTQTGSRSATEAAAAAVGMEPAAALLWFFEVARCLVRDTRQPLTRRRCSCEGLSAAASASGPMPETADRRSAVQLWVLLVAQRRYTGSRMPAPQRQRLGCGGCMDGRAEQGSSQAAEKR